MDVISLVVANGFGKNILTTIEIIISIVWQHRTINETAVLIGWHIGIKNLDHDYLQVRHFDNDFSLGIG